eukprot:UN01728
MAKITAARKQIKKQNKGALAKAAKALAPKTDKTGVAKLRKNITPGTVLILLAGAHKGKRVVFLKQLKSGLLLVTGLIRVNGIPLRRVNQAYVIATSSKVELPAAVVDAAAKADDVFFKNVKAHVAKQNKFIAKDPKAERVVNAERVALQKDIDAALLPALKAKGEDFVKYMATRFTLTKNVKVHALKF